jgi:two-component system nitrogen regulation sensor histidine kinase GlnL
VAEATGELVIVSGRFRGQRIPLNQEALRIGRDRTCELVLGDEAASRTHSEIVRRGGDFVLRDLQSTNGTYLNDTRITEALLQNGDRIAVGDTVLLLQLTRKQEKPQIVFSKEPHEISTHFSLSLDDTRFLESKEGASPVDALHQLALLHEFIVDVAGVLHAPALLERAMPYLFRAFDPDRALILLLNPDGSPGLSTTKLRDNLTGDHEQITISRTMAHQLLQKKESFLSLDATSDERLAGAESLHKMRINSIMGAPLQLKDKVLGMLYLDTVACGKPFSEQQLKLCTAMAMQLAVCLENTRLYNELLDAAEFNASVLRSLGSGIVVVDSAGRLLRVNRATQEILGIEEAGLLGRHLDEFPDLAELSRIIRNTLATGCPEERYEILIKTKSKTVPLGLTTSVVSNHTGETIGVVANFRNLEPIRKLEEQVRRSRHLAALGQMAAGVAHEIRNPLNSIRGFAQLLQEAAGNNETQKEYTQIILEEVDRMNRIVQDLLDFSRQRELTMAPVHAAGLLEDMLRDLQTDAEKLKVRLEIIPAPAEPPHVLGSGDKLRQVFRNIILNGLQACQAGGRVAISFAVVENKVTAGKPGEMETRLPPRELAVAVEDNGCGIEPAVIGKIFDPFFTQKDSGTGLGLSISQKIVEQHGGRIEVKSEPGKGSVFTVWLPVI